MLVAKSTAGAELVEPERRSLCSVEDECTIRLLCDNENVSSSLELDAVFLGEMCVLDGTGDDARIDPLDCTQVASKNRY